MRGNPPSRRFLQRVRQLLVSPAGCIRIKLLLTCCISVSLFLFAARSSSCLPWPRLRPPSGSPSSPRQGSTILFNTWKRYDLLKQSVAHYASCSCVDSIHIVWSEPNPPSIPLQRYLYKVVQSNSGGGRNIGLKFDINKEDSLNNRFKMIKDLKTEAVFSIDDDVIFPCTTVDFAYRVWQSAPDTMVGFVPRMHWLDRSIPPEDIRWEGEDPGISRRVGRSGPGRGVKKSTSRGNTIQGHGRGRGPKTHSKKEFPTLQNGVRRKSMDDIEILHTETLIKEVERVLNSSHPDPLDIDKAKKVLKEHEEALMDAIERLTEASEGESDGEHPFSHGRSVDGD